MDRFRSEEDVRDLYSSIDTKVEMARDLLPTLQRKVKRLNGALQGLWALQKKRSTLQRLQQGALLDLQNQYERHLACQQELRTLAQQLQLAGDEIRRNGATARQVELSSTAAQEDWPQVVRDAQTEARQCISELQSALTDAMTGLQTAETAILSRLETRVATVHTAFARFREAEYEPKVNALPPDEREILTRQIQIIEETKDLPDVELKCAQLQHEVRDLSSQMYSFCSDICAAREKICTIRRSNVDAINSELPAVRLSFRRSGNPTRRQSFQNTYSEDAGHFFGYVNDFGGTESYEKFRSLFAQLKDMAITEDSWKVRDLLWDTKFVEFLRVVDDDDADIAMHVGEAGFVPIQNLSAGQRCTAVFPLLLRNTRGPLVIDQPEDNLDNRYIANVIAPDLLNKKRTQQFITTSHNANLVVLTDADLIMQADSNGKIGSLQSRGFFSCADSAIRQSVIDVLDGGDQAILSRQRKYGTRK